MLRIEFWRELVLGQFPFRIKILSAKFITKLVGSGGIRLAVELFLVLSVTALLEKQHSLEGSLKYWAPKMSRHLYR